MSVSIAPQPCRAARQSGTKVAPDSESEDQAIQVRRIQFCAVSQGGIQMTAARSITVALLPWLMLASGAFAHTTEPVPRASFHQSGGAKRHILAIKYADHQKTRIDMLGTAIKPHVKGKGEIEFTRGRSS